MTDVIATIWDFDKTLIDGYMQTPLFESRGIDPSEFWAENEAAIQAVRKSGVDVNPDTFYLNLFLRKAKKGQPFYGLSNKELKEAGKSLKFRTGVIDLFNSINKLSNEPLYKEFGVKFENYIVSTGIKKIIEGSEIASLVTHIWGAEFGESNNEDGNIQISEIAYSLDNTSKTRALFEISKGSWNPEYSVDVNTRIPDEKRRVRFCNMVYIADGPSDVPAFSVINQKNGATLAVYPRGNKEAFSAAEKLRADGRVNMFAEANFEEASTASMWIMEKILKQGDKLVKEKKDYFQKLGPGTPRHLPE